MALLSSLFNILDKKNLGEIAGALGESEQTVSRSMQTSMATVLGGLASKADEPGLLRKMLDLVPGGSGDSSWANMVSGIADPNSPVLAAGKRILPALFGASEGAVMNAVAAESGLRPGIASWLMAMAAPVVLSFLGKRVRDEGMSMGSLSSLLHRETPAIRAFLPSSLDNMFWPTVREATTTASPIVAQGVAREKSSASWLVPVALLALIPCLFWLFNRARRPETVTIPSAPIGSAQRAVPEVNDIVKPRLPDSLDLHFDTGSARLQPKSQKELDAFAAAVAGTPDARISVGGYTDNVGSAERNIKLSKKRADNVMAQLASKGIATDRLTAAGWGAENPVATNSTAEGRARNRRVAVGVTQP